MNTPDRPEVVGTERFWTSLRAGTLELPRCTSCTALVWYPRTHCPHCMSAELSWERLSGRGKVYSCTVNRRGQGVYRDLPPVTIAYVELDEGPRVLAHLAEVEDRPAAIGDRVQLTDPAGPDGASLLRFAPAP